MLMTTRAMRVTVRQFFPASVSDINDINLKCQCFTGKGMIGIDINIKFTNFNDCCLSQAIGGIDVYNHTYL
jgi:hypothetical protein